MVSRQTDREIWVTVYAAQLAGGDELVTEIHLSDAEQAWVDTMAEIAAKENSADGGPVDERV